MAVITPTTVIRENMGSNTLLINNCTAVSNGDTLNCANVPILYWATVTSCGATGNSALVRLLSSGSTLTVSFLAQPMNMIISYACDA